MIRIAKKVEERYKRAIPKFQNILTNAKDRDINEADTVAIIQDILSEVFGYDKYHEITCEFTIRGTYCDLAVKIDDKVQFLIEVKAIGLPLKDHHLKQAIDYGTNKGIQWVVLTNGISWDIYRILFEKPIDKELLISLDFLQINPRKKEDQEKLFLFSKEGLSKSVREDYYEKIQSVNRFVIGAILLSEPSLSLVRRELKKLSSGLNIELEEVKNLLKNEVLKRDVIDAEDALKAKAKIKRLAQKTPKRQSESKMENIEIEKTAQVEKQHKAIPEE